MKICVYGLTHLGLVTSACLAKKGFDVVGLDTDEDTVYNLNVETDIRLPIPEPNLKELIKEGMLSEKLSFSNDFMSSLDNSDVLCVCFDTPVNNENISDFDYVMNQVRYVFRFIPNGTVVIISSQLPVGSTRKLENEYIKRYPDRNVTFVYSPENLRRGKAIEGFNNPDRVIVGTNDNEMNIKFDDFFRLIFSYGTNYPKNFCETKYMSFESAEMVKHALNSYLAMSISFANEIGNICEIVGANPIDVEYGLKSDSRIGQKAYLKSGLPFFGGTLARDVNYLNMISKSLDLDTPLIKSINISNQIHKQYLENKK